MSMPPTGQDEASVLPFIIRWNFWTLVDAFYFIVFIPWLHHTFFSLFPLFAFLMSSSTIFFLELDVPTEL